MRNGALAARLRQAAGRAAVVGPPSIVGETGTRSLPVVQALLDVAGLIGLLSAATVVFVCWRLLLEDERASIARFRVAGATPVQLGSGAGVVLFAATLACCALGIPAGLAAERLLRSVTAELIGFTGLAAVPTAHGFERPAAAGLLGALAIAGAAWLATIRAFARIPAIEAVRPPDPPPPRPSPHRAQLGAGALALLLAAGALRWLPLRLAGVGIALTAAGAVLLAAGAPGLLGSRLAVSGRGFVWLAAGRQLGADARRSAAISLMVGLSVTAGLTLGGVATSYRAAIDRNVASWTHADLFVGLGRPGQTLRDARFPPSVQRRLAQLPGVAQAGAFTYALVEERQRDVTLQAYDTDHIEGLANLIVYDGVRGAALWHALGRGEAAVSQNMGRLDGLRAGGTVAVPTADGARRLRIAAVIDEYAGEGGTLVVSMRTFARLTGDRRIEDIPLKLDATTTPARAAARVRAALSQYPSLTVLDRRAFRGAIARFVGNVVALFQGLALAAFLIVLLAATLTLAASLTVRRRALAVAQACGASLKLIRAQLCVEAAAMALTAWAIAVLAAALLIPATLRAMAAQTGLLPATIVPLPALGIALPLTLGVALLAARVAARMALRRPIAETLSFE